MTLHEPPNDATVARLRRRWIIAGTIVVSAIAVVAIIASFVQRGPDGATPSTSPTATSSASASASPTPSSTASAPPATASPGVDPGPSSTAGATNPSPGASPSIGQAAPVVPGVTVSVGSLKAVQGEATRPGDIAAPSVQFAVTVVNATSAAIPLASAVVTVDYATTQTPASELSAPGGTTFPSDLAPGQTATAVYVFSVPLDQRDDVRITFDYSAGTPTVAFTGAVPRG